MWPDSPSDDPALTPISDPNGSITLTRVDVREERPAPLSGRNTLLTDELGRCDHRLVTRPTRVLALCTALPPAPGRLPRLGRSSWRTWNGQGPVRSCGRGIGSADGC